MNTFRSALRAVLAAALAAPLAAQAATLSVPSEQFPTIQSALSAAVSGDEVLVAPGEYQENLSFGEKNITLRSVAGKEVTTLDGGQRGTVITAWGSHAIFVYATIEGFTITNGNGGWGGGIYARDDIQLTVRDCLITGNSASAGGGVAANHNAWPQIYDSVISNNTAGWMGGGLFGYVGGSSAFNTTITGNTATYGGGVAAYGFCGSGRVSGGVVSNNTAQYGGGLFAGFDSRCNSSFGLENALVVGNSASVAGGAAAQMGGTMVSSYVTSTTFTGNSAPTGGAFYAEEGANVGIMNSILWGNDTGPVIAPRVNYYTNGIAGSIVQGGTPADLSGVETNLDMDPLFVDAAAGDYHLTAGSPAIDLGLNGGWSYLNGSPAADLDGMIRQSGVPDAGAYEYDNEVPTVAVQFVAPMGTFGWYLAPVDCVFDATDTGVGVASVSVSFDEAAPVTTPGAHAQHQLTTEGFHHVVWAATDLNGNAEWRNHAFSLDFAPAVAAAAVTGPSSNGWYRTASVAVTATDKVSGVARTRYSIDSTPDVVVDGAAASFTLADGRHEVLVGADDVAGQPAAYRRYAIRVDGTAPAVTLATSPTTIKASGRSQAVKVTGSATDATAGVSSTSVKVTDRYGAQVASTSFGGTVYLRGTKGQRYTVTATVKDAAGNSTVKVATVTVL